MRSESWTVVSWSPNGWRFLTLTTDVIVGFPGETEEDRAATEDVCRRIGFAKLHDFPFSPRKGTPAATMPGQVDGNIKARRGDQL